MAEQEGTGIGPLPNEILLEVVESLFRGGDYGGVVALCSTQTAIRGLCQSTAPERMRDLAVRVGLTDYGSDATEPSDMPTLIALARGLAHSDAERRNLEARLRAVYRPLDALDVGDFAAFPKRATLLEYLKGRRLDDWKRLREIYLKDALYPARGKYVAYVWGGPPAGELGKPTVVAFPPGTQPDKLGLGLHFYPTPDPLKWLLAEAARFKDLDAAGWHILYPWDITASIINELAPLILASHWQPRNPDDPAYGSELFRLIKKPLSSYTVEDIDALREVADAVGHDPSDPRWPSLSQLEEGMSALS